MTLRRVRYIKSNADCYEMTLMADDPKGDTIIMTVEEYRERIRKAYDYARYYDLYWEYSATKRLLDEEVGT
jgi:hypothetical protein